MIIFRIYFICLLLASFTVLCNCPDFQFIFLCAIIFLHVKKKTLFFCLLLCLTLFHQTAVVMKTWKMKVRKVECSFLVWLIKYFYLFMRRHHSLCSFHFIQNQSQNQNTWTHQKENKLYQNEMRWEFFSFWFSH